MEQPVLCPQRLNLLHREGWSPAHSPVVCPYTFYIIAVAVAIGRKLTHPTNVANLHAVIGAACLIDVHSFFFLLFVEAVHKTQHDIARDDIGIVFPAASAVNTRINI